MSQELIQIAIFKFKPSLQQGSELPLSFRDVCRQLQAMPGVASSYLGEQLERPGKWTWIIRWASAAAHDAFLASPSFTNWIASFRAVVETYIFWKAHVDAANLPGYHGSFYGQYDVLMHDSPNPPEGNTVSMILGWDSKEAHLAERGEGKEIDNNIRHVREERKSTDMYHVNLKRL